MRIAEKPSGIACTRNYEVADMKKFKKNEVGFCPVCGKEGVADYYEGQYERLKAIEERDI